MMEGKRIRRASAGDDDMDEEEWDEDHDEVAAVLALRQSDDPVERFVGEMLDIESTPLIAHLRRTGPMEWGLKRDRPR
jgi:hypothetical protein